MKNCRILLVLLLFISLSGISQESLSLEYYNEGFKMADSTYSIEKLPYSFWEKNDFSQEIQSRFLTDIGDTTIRAIIGVLSEDNQRFQFRIDKVMQDEKMRSWYYIFGETIHLGESRIVRGTVKFREARLYSDKNKDSVICLLANFEAEETQDLPYTGNYTGTMKMIIVSPKLNDGRLTYDSAEQFYESGAEKAIVGTWTEKNVKFTLPFAIGFERFPDKYAPGFDLGAGEMCINKKYAETWFHFTEEQKKAHDESNSDCINIYSGGFIEN